MKEGNDNVAAKHDAIAEDDWWSEAIVDKAINQLIEECEDEQDTIHNTW